MVRVALFCSGKGSHLDTVQRMINYGIDLEPVFFFSDNTDADCYDKAMDMWPDIEARSMSPFMCSSRKEFDEEVREMMDPYNIELILFLGYMRVVTPTFLKGAPPIINIHPSLLPAFKGKDAIQQALDAGVEIIGATAHYVDEELDGGPIITQEAMGLQDEDFDIVKHNVFILEQRALIRAIQKHLGLI